MNVPPLILSGAPSILASTSGLPASWILLYLLVVTAVAVAVGIIDGRRGGHRARGLGPSCTSAVGRSFLLTWAVGGLLSTLASLFLHPSGPTVLQAFFEAFFIAAYAGAFVSFIFAPIAAFITYNFAARKRAEEEIATLHINDDPQ